MENREIEFRILRTDEDEGIVFYRKKYDNFFLRLIVPWKHLRIAYKYAVGYKSCFDINDIKELKETVKTEKDISEWKRKQKETVKKRKAFFDKQWNEIK